MSAELKPPLSGEAGKVDEPVRAPVVLSARESEVLLWIARGASNNEIAEIVSLSPHTVDTYCRRLLAKFETSSRVTAAVRAAQTGLLPRI